MPDFDAINEAEIEKHNQEVYGGTMLASQKAVMRAMLRKEDLHWMKWDIRKDNQRGRDDM